MTGLSVGRRRLAEGPGRSRGGAGLNEGGGVVFWLVARVWWLCWGVV